MDPAGSPTLPEPPAPKRRRSPFGPIPGLETGRWPDEPDEPDGPHQPDDPAGPHEPDGPAEPHQYSHHWHGWGGSDEPREPTRESFFKRRVAPIGAALLAFLAKVKTILLAVSQIKLLATAGTMLVSIAAYATIWGVWFGVGLVILILVHEMGHVIALRREGIPASAPMFIPFMGAVITSRSLGDNALAEARVGLAGPILGSIGTLVPLLVYDATGHDFWRALAYTGFFINLFNLLPVVPLDGGRAMAAMAPWMWFVGFAGMVALALVWPNPLMLIIVVFAAFELYRRWKGRHTADAEGYYRVSPRNRVLVAVVYLGLVGLLALAMHATHLPRSL